MAFQIPKIEYKVYNLTGNISSGNPQVTNISSTSNLEVGMYVRATGVPVTSKILTVDSATQVTLDTNATATTTGVALEFYFKIEFSYPPIEDTGEEIDQNEVISISRNGKRQVSVSYSEKIRNFEFSFLSETLKIATQTFFESWAGLGRSFRYYEDKTTTNYIDYELSKFKFQPKKITSKTSTTYVWRIALSFRRVA